jgi:hypothetical protein
MLCCTCFTCWAAKSIEELNSQIEKAKLYDSGTGIITGDPEEPLYGRCRLIIFYFLNFFFFTMPAGPITGGIGEALYGRCRLFTHEDLLKFTA